MELLNGCAIGALLAAAVGCVPDFVDDTTRVDSSRIVAIRSDPAEAAEGEQVTLSALVVGTQDTTSVDWTLCVDRKPLSELGPVSPRCLAGPELDPSVAVFLGNAKGATPSVTATLPAIACQLFGPQRPDPKANEPAGRPVDPDSSGGFYQPTLAWMGKDAVLGGVRLTCPLSGATREGLVEYNQRYRRNANPEIQSFELVHADGTSSTLDSRSPTAVLPAERLTLRVSWPECPSEAVCGDGICGIEETNQADDSSGSGLLACAADCAAPRGCGGAERYVSYDQLEQRVVRLEESIVVSWYATAGSFDEPRTGDGSGATAARTLSQNGFTAPASGGVRLWAVVRDDRGGVTWASAALNVVP